MTAHTSSRSTTSQDDATTLTHGDVSSPSVASPHVKGTSKLLAVLVPVAVTVAAAVLVFGLNRPSAPPSPPTTAVVTVGDIERTVQAAGVLQPKLKVDVGAQITGQVRSVHVKLGDWVKAGAPLISLDPEAARTAVQQAEAQLAQQASSLKRAELDLAASQREADRQRRLLEAGVTTNAEQDKAATALARADVEVQAQQAALAQRRADLADKRLQLSRAEVLAPMDGQVVNLAVQEGQSVNAVMASPTLVSLAQLRTITVKTRVPEAEIGLVQPGQVARFTTLAQGAAPHEGRVLAVQPIPERIGSALFYNVMFEVDNSQGKLLSDMTVQVELVVAQAKQVLMLPMAALGVREADGRYSVQLLRGDGSTQSQTVRTGLSNDAYVQVLEGLAPGDRVTVPAVPAASPLTKR